MKNFSSHSSLQNPQPSTIPEPGRGGEEKEEEKARCEWDFNLSAVISSSDPAATPSDAIGVVEFDQDDSLLATGGIARKIRIYSLEKSLESCQNVETGVKFLDHAAACEFYICTPAKLSSIKWKPGSGSRVIGSGDYDGVVMEYDLEKRVPVFERDEHGGRRVWSMDYSHWDPTIGASGSDDGTMQMWDPRCDGGSVWLWSNLTGSPAAQFAAWSSTRLADPSWPSDALTVEFTGTMCAIWKTRFSSWTGTNRPSHTQSFSTHER
ncbi:UNVERIFIED_CONTAM: WD repeat-containing protein RUP2 [Sesamum latifolium]|uniref:WD repeat-containing protein RUP2 n=1 Tax=Sesamum latifolium TaxID=2727402 RepID=A0AAW2T7S0_9LAMI